MNDQAWRPLVALSRRPSLLVGGAVLLVGAPPAAAGPLAPADLGAAALVGVALIRIIRGDRVRPGVAWPLLALVAVGAAAATIASADPWSSTAGLIRYVELFVLVPAAVAIALRDRRDIWILCGAVLLLALAQGALGVWQYLTGTGASYGVADSRAVGTFGAGQVMAMATVVGYGIAVAVGLALATIGHTRRVLFVAAAALVVPLLLSLSRGALVATVAAVLTACLLAQPRLALRVALVAALVTGVTLAAGDRGQVTTRVESITAVFTAPDQSVGDRYDLWRTAVSIWQSSPVTGVGPRQFPAYRDSHAPLSLSAGSDTADHRSGFRREPLLSPHNMYLLVLSEQGVAGALAFVALLIAIASAAVRQVRPPGTGTGTGVALARYAGLAVVVWTMVDFLYGDVGGPATVLTSVLLGLALRVGHEPARAVPPARTVTAARTVPPAQAVVSGG